MTRRVLVAATIGALALALAVQRHAVETFEWRVSALPFAAAVCLFSVCPFVAGVSFWLIVGASVQAPFRSCLEVWQRSFAARYVPFGALTVAVRLAERGRLGVSRAQMLSATAQEHVVAAAAAAAVALLAFPASGRTPPLVAGIVAAAVLALVAGAGWILRSGSLLVVPWPRLAAAGASSALGWLVAGTAAWIFVTALTGGPPPAFAFVVGAYAFAWLVGFVVPFAPSGLGAREAALVALLAPLYGAAPATALAVGLRLANVAGDLVAIATIEAARVHRIRRARSCLLVHPADSS